MEKHSLYLKYNLQFFAKDGPGGEKTEPATAKRLDDARKEGNVAKSRDIVSAITLTASFFILRVTVGNIGTGFMKIFHSVYSMISTMAGNEGNEINKNTVMSLTKQVVIDGFMLVLPIFAAVFAISFIGDLVQVKWRVTTKPMKPKLSKLNPIKGFKKIFSMQSLMNLFKSMALVIIIGFVVISTVSSKRGVLLNLYNVSLMEALGIIGDTVFNLAITISVIYIIVGIIDYIYQKIKFKNDMKMTKQEVKDEFKNAEGDPQIKGQIKQRMRQASMRRMMQSLPNADVVITNPTHFAVALKYETGKDNAPVVLAKGEDYLAQKIKEKAKECNIEIVENKPLARALYANVEVGQEIPEELYQAVAEVLAYVYGLRNN